MKNSGISLKKWTLPLFFLLMFICPLYLYAMSAPVPGQFIPLRVLVIRNADEISINIKGKYRIIDFAGKSFGPSPIKLTADDIGKDGIRILSWVKTRIYINKRQFRGDIDIVKDENNKLMVINHIDIEDYLYGVLYHEVSHRWPIEVLKAQAIAARTYALYQKLISKSRYYDLTSDIYSQVYGGKNSETWSTTRAVDLTRGRILKYKDKIFPTYFHAACGGRSSDADSIWDIDLPILKGRECGFCALSPHYTWKAEFMRQDLRNILKGTEYDIGFLTIIPIKRDSAGRIIELLLKGEKRDVKVNGNKFRLLIGPNKIKSTNFEVSKEGYVFRFKGKGWGHGVGMCQWGAYGMAIEGWKAEEILGYYYPGAEIVEMQ